MTNSNIDDQGRPEPPVASDEAVTILGFLEFQRATLEWKCRNLGTTDLRKKIAASSMTLGGILKHMAYVENHWFSDWLMGREKLSPWREVDWSQDRDWDWNSAADDTPEQLLQLAKHSWPNGDSPSLRWILVHMIEEYARHNGHADLLREVIDGQVGE